MTKVKQQPDGSRELITGLVAVIVTLGALDTFQRDLEPKAGYPASVLGGIVISAIVVFVVCLIGRMPRQKAFATAALLPPTLAAFEQIRKHTVDYTGSGILSLLLAMIFAVLVGAVVAVVIRQFSCADGSSHARSATSEKLK